MHQLLYVSNAVELMSRQELEVLLDQAKANNKALNITGMLVYHDGTFIQILEGEEQQVKSLFEEVKKDPRHDNVILIEEMPVQKRAFASWDMAFRQLSTAELKDYPVIDRLLNKDGQTSSGVLTEIVDVFLDMTVTSPDNFFTRQ